VERGLLGALGIFIALICGLFAVMFVVEAASGGDGKTTPGVYAGLIAFFGGAFEEVVMDPGEIDADPDAVLYVSSARRRRAEARAAGIHAVAPHALAQALAAYSVPATLSVP